MALSPKLPDLHAWEVFLAVARTGSLNAAAAQVGVSQQAVSARIASIEAQTGVVLVTRSARGSTLTSAGTVVAEWAARLLDVAAHLDAGLASLRDDRHATLRISASQTIAEQLLPGWLVTLATEAARPSRPAAEAVLTATNSERVAEHVRDGVADIGFVEGPTAPRGLRTRAVGHDRLVAVARPDHPWARRSKGVSAGDLATTRLVAREEGSGTRDALVEALRRALGPGASIAAPVLVFSTATSVRAAVLAGAGPAVLSELAVTDDLSAGRLVEVAVVGVDLSRTLRAVWVGGATPPAGPVRDLVAIAAGPRRLAR
ncbi:MAG: LysR family transcriptional regulator [Lapillicoccus sp.]